MLSPKPSRTPTRLRDTALSPTRFWAAVFGVWAALVVAFGIAIVPVLGEVRPVEAAALVVIGAASSVIWLAGVRNIAMWTVHRSLSRRRPVAPRLSADAPRARVALLSCAADDFDPAALRASMRQSYAATTVILDDSRSPESRRHIDDFAREHGAEVIRRVDRSGFKAGNVNHGIRRLLHRFDYFVFVDSDGVLPPTFVERALDRFARDPEVGIVQARHVAHAGETAFTRFFSSLLGTHIDVTQSARSALGFSMFMGRGAMLSADAFRATTGIPEMVMEDVGFSLLVRRAGYRIEYAPDIVCVEDYPIDYRAFRTQHRKVIEGTTEFVRRFARDVVSSRMRVHEKIDLLIEQTMVPAMAVSGMVLMAAAVVLTMTGGDVQAPHWALALSGLGVASPLLAHTARLARSRGIVRAAAFLPSALALYGSTLVLTIAAVARVLSGRRAVFHVTPKRRESTGAWARARELRTEWIVALAATAFGLGVVGLVTPVMPLLIPAVAGTAFAVLGALTARGTAPAVEVTPARSRADRDTTTAPAPSRRALVG